MNKKIMAVAVAGALALPGVALAQSSVTISGIFKVGLDRLSVGATSTSRAAGLNTSEWRVSDNSSRIIFGVTEDLGGGLAAVAQLDVRFQPDNASTGLTTNPIGSGNTWVGLRSKTMGTLTMGRWDLHYGKQPDDIASKAGALMASSVSLMDYAGTAGGGNAAIAGATRTSNVIKWDSPNWGGFAMTAAYSTNPTTVEGDLASTARRGNAWNLNPTYTAANWGLGWSYWNSKPDAVGAVAINQRSDILYGYYMVSGFKLGLAWKKDYLDNVAAAGTTRAYDVRKWNLPISYTTGNHNVYFHYTKAGSDKAPGAAGLDTQAKMWALAYVYDLSKRTSVGVTYAKINNGAASMYSFFTNNNNGGFGSSGGAALGGEDPSLWAFNIRHAF